MSTVIETEFVQFTFGDRWTVVSYDRHPSVEKGIGRIRGTKRADVVGIHPDMGLMIFEATDYRRFAAPNIEVLLNEALAKFRDTAAGIALTARIDADPAWMAFAAAMSDGARPCRAVLWYDDSRAIDIRERKTRAATLSQKLKHDLCGVGIQAFVMSLESAGMPHLDLTATLR